MPLTPSADDLKVAQSLVPLVIEALELTLSHPQVTEPTLRQHLGRVLALSLVIQQRLGVPSKL